MYIHKYIQSSSYLPQTDIWRRRRAKIPWKRKFDFDILLFGGGAARFTHESEKQTIGIFYFGIGVTGNCPAAKTQHLDRPRTRVKARTRFLRWWGHAKRQELRPYFGPDPNAICGAFYGAICGIRAGEGAWGAPRPFEGGP